MKKQSNTRLRRTVGAIAAAGALAASVAMAGAVVAQSGISDERARRIALEHVPGTVIELEREDEGGQAVIEVEVRDAQNVVHEITLDARDGRVIKIEEETDGPDDEDGDEDDDADGEATTP